MKKSWATKWVKALRSGKYKQAKNKLKAEDGHCCLGVLCTLTRYKNNYTQMKDFPTFGTNQVLPHKIVKLVGMKTSRGAVDGITLTSLNDTGKNFNEIADFIQKNWAKL